MFGDIVTLGLVWNQISARMAKDATTLFGNIGARMM
jgi:hypothetical protein